MAIRVLSAGAVQPAVVKVIDAFCRESGYEVKITFATAPEIRKRLRDGEPPDVVIAPPAVLDELVKAGKTAAAGRVPVGRIGIGVIVRDGAPLPKISTVEEFKQSLLGAAAVVYNQASTGIYLEQLFSRLGISEQLNPKTIRYPAAAPVLDHISKGMSGEVGFAATTVIIENESKGLKFVGPIPADIQNYTTYAAALVADSAASDAARAFVAYLATPDAKAVFAAAGIA